MEIKALNLIDPWLVAVWPGMGGIAQIAGSHLIHQLGAEPIAALHAEQFFDTRSVGVHAGLIQGSATPKNEFFGWKNPGSGPDLVVFVGEEQPAVQGMRYGEELLRVAGRLEVSRVFTFAAMASPIQPDAPSRVFAAANRPELLSELRKHDLQFLEEGTIAGLNGLLLAAAAERSLPGACLLGEFPFFARAIANPKASAAILRCFAGLAGLEFDLHELDAQAEQMERLLTGQMQQLQRAAELAVESANHGNGKPAEGEQPAKESLDPKIAARIEELFRRAQEDRSEALELKTELDRHGVFPEFEDRFLDLFKQAE